MQEVEYSNSTVKKIKKYRRYIRKRAIKALFEKESLSYSLTDYNYFIQIFCWFKTFICLILNKTKGSYTDKNKFDILNYDEYKLYEGSVWSTIWVSPYYFKDWNVYLGTNSD